MRLVIGAAQFGMSYGLANQVGKVSQNEVRKILINASKFGVNILDTAIAYGDSEDVLGKIGIENWKVITKLPVIPLDVVNISDWVHKQIEESLKRLSLPCVDAILLHRPEQLNSERGKEILAALQNIKNCKLTKKIGVSIYHPSELNDFDNVQVFDLIQTPLSVLDRSLIESGWLKKLNELKIEIHVRSIFLQGLLLMSPKVMPEKFSRYNKLWLEWDRWLAENQLSPLEGCIAYINSIHGLDGVVVGVESSRQLNEIIVASTLKIRNVPNWSENIDPNLINPSSWSSL